MEPSVGIGYSAIVNLLRNAGLQGMGLHVVYMDNLHSEGKHRGMCNSAANASPQLQSVKMEPTDCPVFSVLI